MSASQITWLVFEIINYAAIILTSVGFLFQIVMILFFFLKEKKFPKSEKVSRIAICIPGHNEAEVIGTTVRRMLEELDYPRDHYDVFVCAHNCTDETARLAEEAGAKVLVLDDPSQKTAGYPTDFLFKHVMKEELGYDFAIKFDADNIPDKNYLRAMNDAYQSGVEIARPFEASTNATQNTWTAVSAAYYIRDGRIACNFRERLHLDSILTGAGMMVSTKVMRECGGYDAYSRSDDTEFSLKRLCESKRIHYVADAIVYEDQPSSAKDTYARLSRMGNGINRVFWKYGFKLLGHFFVSGRWSNVDLFVQIMFVPLDVICFLWYPLYYIAYAICHIMNGFGQFAGQVLPWLGADAVSAALASQNALLSLALMAGVVVLSFLVLYTAQTFLAIFLVKKKLGMKHIKGMKRGAFLSSLFMVFYGFCVIAGIFTNAGWAKVTRNQAAPALEAPKEAEPPSQGEK